MSVEDQSFMLACLKLAKTYTQIVEGELRLYASRTGHKPLETNFGGLRAAIDERITMHTGKLNAIRNEKPKWKDPAACSECGGTPVSGHTMFCSVKPKVKLKPRQEVSVEQHTPKVLVKKEIPSRPKLKKRAVL